MRESEQGYYMVYLEQPETLIKELEVCSSFEVDAPYHLEGRMKCTIESDTLVWKK
jgi:hypothetical protein